MRRGKGVNTSMRAGYEKIAGDFDKDFSRVIHLSTRKRKSHLAHVKARPAPLSEAALERIRLDKIKAEAEALRRKRLGL